MSDGSTKRTHTVKSYSFHGADMAVILPRSGWSQAGDCLLITADIGR